MIKRHKTFNKMFFFKIDIWFSLIIFKQKSQNVITIALNDYVLNHK